MVIAGSRAMQHKPTRQVLLFIQLGNPFDNEVIAGITFLKLFYTKHCIEKHCLFSPGYPQMVQRRGKTTKNQSKALLNMVLDYCTTDLSMTGNDIVFNPISGIKKQRNLTPTI